MPKERIFHLKHENRKNKQIKQGFSYRNRNPSEVTDVYWLYSLNNSSDYPDATINSGKWLIFVSNNEVDSKWKIIRQATEEGVLGRSSKVSTFKSSPIARNPYEKVICVYTYDWTDEKDVMNIRNQLKKLGFNKEIYYKSDLDTMEGKYSWKGDKVEKYRK